MTITNERIELIQPKFQDIVELLNVVKCGGKFPGHLPGCGK